MTEHLIVNGDRLLKDVKQVNWSCCDGKRVENGNNLEIRHQSNQIRLFHIKILGCWHSLITKFVEHAQDDSSWICDFTFYECIDCLIISWKPFCFHFIVHHWGRFSWRVKYLLQIRYVRNNMSLNSQAIYYHHTDIHVHTTTSDSRVLVFYKWRMMRCLNALLISNRF